MKINKTLEFEGLISVSTIMLMWNEYYIFYCDIRMFKRPHLSNLFPTQIFVELDLNYSGNKSDIKQYMIRFFSDSSVL